MLKFVEFNDDVLFGDIWVREEKLFLWDCSMIIVFVLIVGEIVEIIIYFLFYVGWFKVWLVFYIVKGIFKNEKKVG